MITFLVSIALLIIGYFTYGKIVEKIFQPKQERVTPAYTKGDGVDYLPMHKNKNLLIQLISIAGVGPIFGPIMGALYGPVAFIWIVLGCIFAGAVHDYLTGMISIRNGGAHLPELAGRFLGKAMKHVVNAFSILLLLLVGTVFVASPAGLLYDLTNGVIPVIVFVVLIFIYFLLATILPINKIIGTIYPYLGAILLVSTVGVGGALVVTGAPIPELSFTNTHPAGAAIFPLLFLTISCGALSGFHATQSPIISRTTQNERQGRRIFFGAMIAEGIIAMIWAAAAMSLFDGPVTLSELINTIGTGGIVNEVSTMLLGSIFGTIAVIGIILLPITSGDTAFRSARMIIADYIKVPQKKIMNRMLIAAPLFITSIILTTVDFTMLWQYFNWANQSTAVIALWIGAMFLYIAKRNYWIAIFPAWFMTMTASTYIANAPIGFNLPMNVSLVFGGIFTVLITFFFFKFAARNRKNNIPIEDDVSDWKPDVA
ncbi:CstA-like carbon starvation protein [Alkalihalobacillus alcalophilus ATCC 27647 = CGMCC 1.3604]|uniref:Carbon starvation protein CstA n=1 Tax=Alkalihalobacillus alcalophilus ATCC 27647 = CGMCC 1.3604 TaxID=1218173 RepID=A0A094XJQ9_ALKAL|nr:carbon starvation CstA family protein [Alkalihalobacillus alcalophilus]KGA99015.1 carbon starvation protein CstA [Alkalihalobacillus alcalophilus ATCC 27647 = CGMCC 1.3604]MED1560653.1 carbon starvation CstA family protein [Alkalihalobacillus alcalophilus]THG89670.1 CstA-like carbon starvation protein [Alkalihalobacillus alcalophilus ATCC 27647 = CGMCC 1.3604]